MRRRIKQTKSKKLKELEARLAVLEVKSTKKKGE